MSPVESSLRSLARSLLIGTASLLAFTGCTSKSLTLSEPTLPVPLLDPIPLRVGIKYSPEMHDFTHHEELLANQKWTISLGEANKLLYDQIFKAMFDETVILGPDDSPQLAGVDLMIVPSVEAFEFALPQQSRTETYTVWIRYRLVVYDKAGEEIANWPVSAYGKSGAGKFDGNKAIQRATALAMRDAAALVSMRFISETGLLKSTLKGSEEINPDALVNDQGLLPGDSQDELNAGGSGQSPDIRDAEKFRNDQG